MGISLAGRFQHRRNVASLVIGEVRVVNRNPIRKLDSPRIRRIDANRRIDSTIRFTPIQNLDSLFEKF